ncbi:MAG: hypothetical protein MJZ25_12665 [Fibrobacter sp.]|nr:hypothetical protein [Fibrobacter sp.]
MKSFAAPTTILAILASLWVAAFFSFHSNELTIFPSNVYEVYALTDRDLGGFSVCDLKQTDSVITADVNIHSGMAYPYAGIGFNLMSVNKRPSADFFDFSRFDSIEVLVETGRMRNVTTRMLNNDPVYSKDNLYASYRPLQKSTAVGKGVVALSLQDLNVPDRWFADRGLDKDDGMKYLQRGVMLEVSSGEGTMLGIPDEIKLRGVRLWGENHSFVTVMYVVLGLMLLLWIASLIWIRRR